MASLPVQYLFEQPGARTTGVLHTGLHQPGHVSNPLVAILRIAGDGGHIHLGDAGLAITEAALAAKSEIEKIREQSQNLE
jgi:hypothetical protein